MENIEIEKDDSLVTEQVTENVEQTTEQTPRMFSQEEVNDIVGKAKTRTRAKVEREYERKYSGLETVLKAGTGKESVEELEDTFRNFYEQKGVKIAKKPDYTAEDIEVLAKSDAEDIIRGGYEEVLEEGERLANLGAKLTPRERAVLAILADHAKGAERARELSQLGVTEDVYNSKEFNDFAAQFNKDTPITDVYKLYAKTVKPNVEPIGSMKNGSHDEGKTFYTPEEVDKLTPKDLDNPVIFQRVRDSMKLWK